MEPQKVNLEELFQIIGELTVQLKLAQKAAEGLKQRITFLEKRSDEKST